MDWWMAGLALSALLAWSARGAGRPGRATAPALMTMRAVGGLCLIAMAALALDAGARGAAVVAATGAAPLLLGLLGRVRQAPDERAATRQGAAPAPEPVPDAAREAPAPHEERRAA